MDVSRNVRACAYLQSEYAHFVWFSSQTKVQRARSQHTLFSARSISHKKRREPTENERRKS